MHEPATTTETTTQAPADGAQSKTVDADVIAHPSRSKMIEHLRARGHEFVDDDEPAPKAAPKKDEGAETDEQAEAGKTKEDPPEVAKLRQEHERVTARVGELEERDREWAKASLEVLAQRDHSRDHAAKLEQALQSLGYEVDPNFSESSMLKLELQRLKREAELRDETEAEAAKRVTQERAREATEGLVQTARTLVKKYPELSPKNEAARKFWNRFAKAGGDLEEDAREWVHAQRALRAQAEGGLDKESRTPTSTTRPLVRTRTPQTAPKQPEGMSEIRAYAHAKYGEPR